MVVPLVSSLVALDITLTELAIETFLPADAATAELLRRRFGVPAG